MLFDAILPSCSARFAAAAADAAAVAAAAAAAAARLAELCSCAAQQLTDATKRKLK